MSLPNGVTQAQWEAALVNCGLWKPGQPCIGTIECDRFKVKEYFDERNRPYKAIRSHDEVPHDIPCPEPTDALLMAILRFGMEKNAADWYGQIWGLWALGHNLNAAIILAAAALKKET